ncbi:hypothetical protein [Lacticaseibacillus jixiensis]|uniref:hypothetical protein n=1 Tax=Lacticaseibacillus jixiensis TaxID=3231926 RepID=UPI0036F3F002
MAINGVAAVGKMLRRYGVDAAQFQLLVANKRRLANRDTSLGLGISSNKPSTHALRNSLLMDLLIGFFLMLLLWMMGPAIGYTMYYATFMLWLFMVMLTGYSPLMLDPKDRNQFFTRGVSASTINAARLYVVGWYLLLNTAALGVFALVPTVLRFGVLAAVLFAVGLLLCAVFSLVAALLVYLLVLRFFDGERLKNLLNLLQIALMIAVYAGSQILPRLSIGSGSGAKHLAWWLLLTPPAWFAGLPTVGSLTAQASDWIAAGLAIVVPVVMAWFYARHAANFEQYLAKLDTANDAVRKLGWYYRLCRRIFAAKPTVSGYFLLAWQHLRQEREYKLRVYPNLAYMMVVLGVLVLNFNRDSKNLWQSMAPFLPYVGLMVAMSLPLAVINLNFSDQPQAMRVFTYVPFAEHGALVLATVEALFARLIVPIVLILGVFGIAGVGVRGVLSLAAVLAVDYMATLLIGRQLLSRGLPFAAAFDPNRNAASGAVIVPVFLSMAISFGLIYAGAYLHAWWFDLVLLVAAGGAAWLIRRSYAQIWFELQQRDMGN